MGSCTKCSTYYKLQESEKQFSISCLLLLRFVSINCQSSQPCPGSSCNVLPLLITAKYTTGTISNSCFAKLASLKNNGLTFFLYKVMEQRCGCKHATSFRPSHQFISLVLIQDTLSTNGIHHIPVEIFEIRKRFHF